jgi:hypothetical protein
MLLACCVEQPLFVAMFVVGRGVHSNLHSNQITDTRLTALIVSFLCSFGSHTTTDECSLVQADGKHDLEKLINKGDNTDLFKKGSVFKNRKWWNGKAVGLELHIKSNPGGVVTLAAVGQFKGTDEVISTRPTSPPVASGIGAACGKCEIM